ncbi:MAG: carbon storage regulator [Planctomycetes bacterium]|nr:carbon storage regulator [Planctomycetota bacterium]
MLVLTRKTKEKIFIGESVVVTLLEIRGDKIRLGIEAPKNVSILRGEVKEAIELAEIQQQRKENRDLPND